MRTDIPLPAQAVQACHAALERPTQSTHLVLFAIKNEQELFKTKDMLINNGIDYSMFYEPDFDMGYTAIATEPIHEADKRIFKRYRLWKGA